jgi:hypothetical protein
MSDIATHDPAPDSDFVIRVDLAGHGMPGRREQLWAKQVAPTRFVLRSIPFFAYGIRPGDEVETDEGFSVQRVVHSSGNQVLRVAVSPAGAGAIQAELHSLLEHLGLSHEWHREGYVAIKLPSDAIPHSLLSYIEPRAHDGQLHFELA